MLLAVILLHLFLFIAPLSPVFPVAAVVVPIVLIILIAGFVAGFFIYRRKSGGKIDKIFNLNILLLLPGMLRK